MPKKLADLVIMAPTESNCNLKIQGHFTYYYKVKRELMTTLLNTSLEKALRNIEINPQRTIFNRIQDLAYIDDVVILEKLVRRIEEVLAQKKRKQ
jgi:hypothetical protein